MAEKVEHFPTILPGPRKERGVKTKAVDLKKVGVGVVGVVGAAAAVAYGASEIRGQQQTPELSPEALFLAFHPEQRDQLASLGLNEEARIQIAGTDKSAEDVLKELDKVVPPDEIGRSFGIFTPEEMTGLLGSMPGGAKIDSLRILASTAQDGEKTQFLFAQNGQGSLEAIKYVVSQDSQEPGFVGWAKPVTQRDNELWSLVWNTDKGEWTWVFYGASGENFGKPGTGEGPVAAPTVPSAPPTETAASTPTRGPVPTETPTKTVPPPPPPTRTEAPTSTPTPKSTETATPVPTPEAPHFPDRTEGRKTGETMVETAVGSGKFVPITKILDPNAGPSENPWGPVIHRTITHALGFEEINGRDTNIISIDRATRTVVFDIGAGQTISRVIPADMRIVMKERVIPAGKRTVESFYHTGGTLGDLEEGDRVGILVDPTNPQNEFWGIWFIQ